MADENNPVVEANVYDKLVNVNQAKILKESLTLTSNPNLLINPDFRINQRGKTTYTGYCYTVDRWSIWSDNGNPTDMVLTPTDYGISITGGSVKTYLQNKIPNILSQVTGKMLTASMTLEDGTIFICTGKCPDVKTSNAQLIAYVNISNNIALRLYLTGFSDNNDLNYQLRITNGEEIRIKCAKVEIGSIATQFLPPDPATELIKCQRYYQIRSAGDIAEVDLRPSMAAIPEIKQREDGNYEYIAEL